MKAFTTATAAAALMIFSGAASAQTSNDQTEQQPSRQQERLNSIFGALFGGQTGSTDTIEAQWAVGRTPLATQRLQFDARIDADVRNRALDQATGARLKADYAALVQLEARYGADRRFTTQERTDLADRYGALTQVLSDGSYGDDNDDSAQATSVASGQSEFNRRVDASVSARKITRTAATRLKTDYSALIQVEAGYLRDGTISSREQDDLDARLDDLDMRVGDVAYQGGAVVQTPRTRLDAIASALPASGLTAASQAQLRVEHQDLSRLEAAYARISATAEERAYLDRRLGELELRAKVRR